MAKPVLGERCKPFETIRWIRKTPEPFLDPLGNQVLPAANSSSGACTTQHWAVAVS